VSRGKGNNDSASKAEELMACFVSYSNHNICVKELLTCFMFACKVILLKQE